MKEDVMHYYDVKMLEYVPRKKVSVRNETWNWQRTKE